MNKLRISSSFIIIITSLFFLIPQVLAADLNIACQAPPTTCSKTGLDPLFSTVKDGYWYPGRTLTKTINLKNSSPEKREMAIKGKRTSSISILEDVMQISIVGGTTVIWGGDVADFYSQDKIGMGIFNSGADFDYDFTVSMDIGAGDNYQNQETVFELSLGFWGEPVPTPTPTTTPVPTPTPAPGEVLGAGVTAPVCGDTPPGGTPVLLSAILGVNSVTLTWSEAPDPVSYYLIAYGTASSVYSFGNPNVGGKGTTSYTVSNLSGGVMYYFVVRAGNGCAPGPFSDELSAVPTGEAVVGPAVGFAPGVLGEATPSAELEEAPEEIILEEEKVAGVEVVRICFWWWVLLIIEGLILVLYLLFLKVKKPQSNYLFPICLWLLSIFAHSRLEKAWNLQPSRLCPWFWLLDALLLTFLSIAYSFWKRRAFRENK